MAKQKEKWWKRLASKEQKLAIWIRDNGICQICFKPVDFNSKWHADHIKPCARGGNTTIKNLRTAHAYCNQAKSSFDRVLL